MNNEIMIKEIEELKEKIDEKYSRKYISGYLNISTKQVSRILKAKANMKLDYYFRLKQLLEENKL